MEYEKLIDDEYGHNPGKRCLDYLLRKHEQGVPIVGEYCCYAPRELVLAMGGFVAPLCSFSEIPIIEAEKVLPANLCPLVKSSYGFIITDTCPFYALSDAVIAETTCDAKKKLWELIIDRKPTHILELPQMPSKVIALHHWYQEVKELKEFLEQTFKKEITNDRLEQVVHYTNKIKKQLVIVASFAAFDPPLIHWEELYDAIYSYSISEPNEDAVEELQKIIHKLQLRHDQVSNLPKKRKPRVLVTGCPLGGNSLKVMKYIDQCGGVIVAHESCSGIKPLLYTIEENTGDPLKAIAKKYLQLPCSVMTVNHGRIRLLETLIQQFRPDVVIDVILTACHTYNVESYSIKKYITETWGLPFLKIETDYSMSDEGSLKTRIEALIESV